MLRPVGRGGSGLLLCPTMGLRGGQVLAFSLNPEVLVSWVWRLEATVEGQHIPVFILSLGFQFQFNVLMPTLPVWSPGFLVFE